MLKNPILNRSLVSIIYKNQKILKKYLTKREKSGKIGKLSERAAKIQRLRLCQNPEKNFEKSFKKVLTKG